jgi:hypothetical protein
LHAFGEICISLLFAEIFERQDRDRFFRRAGGSSLNWGSIAAEKKQRD